MKQLSSKVVSRSVRALKRARLQCTCNVLICAAPKVQTLRVKFASGYSFGSEMPVEACGTAPQ